MKKIFLLALVAMVLALFSCSNSSDSSGATTSETPAPAPAAPQEETWPQITPVDFNVDLEGFEECPKDETYGINWVFIAKSRIDKLNTDKYFKGEDFRLKPVEFHKSNPNGVQFWLSLAQVSKSLDFGNGSCILYLILFIYDFALFH